MIVENPALLDPSYLDRKAILIALAREGQLTQERQITVRAGAPKDVRAALLSWGVAPSVILTAGMPVIKPPTTTRMKDREVQRQVDLHLTALGYGPAAITWTHPNIASRVYLDETWEALLQGAYVEWALPLYPSRIARLLAYADRDPWRPLLRLIEHAVHPYGLAERGDFIVVDTTIDPQTAVLEEIERQERALFA